MYVLILKDLSIELIAYIVIPIISVPVFFYVKTKFSSLVRGTIKEAVHDYFKKHDQSALEIIKEVEKSHVNLSKESGSLSNQLFDFRGVLEAKMKFLNSVEVDKLKLLDKLADIDSLKSSLVDQLGKINELIFMISKLKMEQLLEISNANNHLLESLNADITKLKSSSSPLDKNDLVERIENLLSDFEKRIADKMDTETIVTEHTSNDDEGQDEVQDVVLDKFTYLPILFDDKVSPAERRIHRCVSFYNFKGGVGKTTLTFNIAHHMANTHGKRILLIDLDSQANLSYLTLGNDAYSEAHWTVPKLFMHLHQEKHVEMDVKAWMTKSKHSDKVNIIANEHEQHGLEVNLVYHYCQQKDLRNVWLQLLDNCQFDYVFFDCPPQLGFLTQSALIASDMIVSPISMGACERFGLKNLDNDVREWFEVAGIPIEEKPIEKVVLNNFSKKSDGFVTNAQAVIDNLKNTRLVRKKAFNAVVPSVTAKEFFDEGKIFDLKGKKQESAKEAIDSICREMMQELRLKVDNVSQGDTNAKDE